eukprot:Pgem_evm2s13562
MQLQIPLPTCPPTLISGHIPPTYLPLDVTYYRNQLVPNRNNSNRMNQANGRG